ncbi:histone-lysine N-methyltransferase SETMAR [Trichonephila clavipes]|uniref:Histone-lysine N-methyltransferase SETMAR n=1 Tax=Trichonephila clavipes TaxID=2585209 RepID=A0A8X6SLG8_TRICX|nr:histone-lysine N-methyltransferase SETMAR [Trichonephila clavipes]
MNKQKVSQPVPGKKKWVLQIEHPPYSPNLNPLVFFPFLRLKLSLKGKIYDNIPNIQRNVTRLLNSILKKDLSQSFQEINSRSQWCIVMGGDYFKGQ